MKRAHPERTARPSMPFPDRRTISLTIARMRLLAKTATIASPLIPGIKVCLPNWVRCPNKRRPVTSSCIEAPAIRSHQGLVNVAFLEVEVRVHELPTKFVRVADEFSTNSPAQNQHPAATKEFGDYQRTPPRLAAHWSRAPSCSISRMLPGNCNSTRVPLADT